jgi:nucleotide-binding universal stress UspA family protein
MYETILVPTDGSDHSVRAAEHGYYLAGLFDATVHVLNVVDVQRAGGVFDAGGVDQEFLERLQAEGQDAAERIEAVGDDREQDTMRTAVVRGKPSETILDYVGDHGVDVIAMGTHGRTGLDRYVAGSVTERVVRLSPVPVLTARATDRSRIAGDYDDVLVPTDGSETAATAVDHGLAVARPAGARVHAVNVVDVSGLVASPADTPPPEVLDQLGSEGAEVTDRIAGRARQMELDAVTAVREGVPASGLLEYAEEHDVDLITMGTAGRTGLSRHLVGSTTERLIRHAEMPVLAVNARE